MSERSDSEGRTVIGVNVRGSHSFTGRLMFGLIVLTLGVVWTLDNLDLVDASQVLRWWGVVPLAWGTAVLAGWQGPRRTGLGLFWVVVGAVAVLHAANLVSVSVGQLWPLFFIFIGANIVFRSLRGGPVTPSGPGGIDQSYIHTFAMMAGNEHKVTSQSFRGGDVNAVMGGAEVDLRSAQLESGRAEIEVFAMWGGVELVVPAGWRVQSEVTPIMAGYEDSTVHPTDPQAPVLVVRGFAVMGGVEVTNKAPGGKRVTIVSTVGQGGTGVRKEVRVTPTGVTITRGPATEVPPAGSAPPPVDPE